MTSFFLNATKVSGVTATVTAALQSVPVPPATASNLEHLWQLAMLACFLFAGLYFRSLYKQMAKIMVHEERLNNFGRYFRSIVNILAEEARAHGERRTSDALLIALQREMENDGAA